MHTTNKLFGHFNCLTFIYFFLHDFTVIFGQKVILKKNETKCPTECGTVLKNGTDRIILYGEVDFTNVAESSLKTVFLEIGKSSDIFSMICFIRTSIGCVRVTNNDCYCERIDSDGIYHMVFNITALVKYSEADARISYTFSTSTTITSNFLKLPKISEDVAPVITIISSTNAVLQITTTLVPVMVGNNTSENLGTIRDLLIVLTVFVILIFGLQVGILIQKSRLQPFYVPRTRYTVAVKDSNEQDEDQIREEGYDKTPDIRLKIPI